MKLIGKSTRRKLKLSSARAILCVLCSLTVALHLVSVPWGSFNRVSAAGPMDFTDIQSGGIPIILTAPHGGWVDLNVSERTGENLPGGDSLTYELTGELSAKLEQLLGRKPFVVRAKFQRKYIDANRAANAGEQPAYADDAAAPYYDYYHGKIREYVDTINNRWSGKGILLDIHGQSDAPSTILRGTNEGRTVLRLRNRNGQVDDAPLIGPNSIFGGLHAYGYSVYPPTNVPVAEKPSESGCLGFNGGYTVQKYGGNDSNQIDAIQIEVGKHLRSEEARGDFVQALANSIAGFYKAYLASGVKLSSLPSVPAVNDLPPLTTTTANGRMGSALAKGDFNGDGQEDIAVGKPGDDPAVRIYFGAANGVLPAAYAELKQKDINGDKEVNAATGDRYGEALAVGDFNGDGKDDLAVGIPGEDDIAADAGAVAVFYGTANGLTCRKTGKPDQFTFQRLEQKHVEASSENNDHFGAVLAAGDFNGDGLADLTVGAPDEDDEVTDDGMVVVFYGSPTGLLRQTNGQWHAAGYHRLGQKHTGARSESFDHFGTALAAGDFNHDGKDDLAVGVPYEDDQAADDGMVVVFYGSPNGLLHQVNGQWRAIACERLGQRQVDAYSENSDHFGAALASGDFNRDGQDDLAIGVPNEDDETTDDGMVVIYYGSSSGLLRLVNNQWRAFAYARLAQKQVEARAEAGDLFGSGLTVGDFNGDNYIDLAIGAPGEDDEATDDGMVVVYYGSSSGLLRLVNGDWRASSYERLGQRRAGGTNEVGDHFGWALAAGDFNGDGKADLAIGTPGEDLGGRTDIGTLYIYNGSSRGLIR